MFLLFTLNNIRKFYEYALYPDRQLSMMTNDKISSNNFKNLTQLLDLLQM